MFSLDKIIFLQLGLLRWFASSGRHFQWRKNGLLPYELIISEVLLQRTKAETVSKFFDSFLIAFPNWEAIAFAELISIEEFLRPIGLHRQRAKRLQNLARYMVQNDKVLPADRLELNKVPFMGQYIANAVELLVFNRPKPLLDVNMARVLERYFGNRKLADIRYDPDLQDLAHKFAMHARHREVNWSILDFAALVCKARKPLCLNCPVNFHCKYFKESGI